MQLLALLGAFFFASFCFASTPIAPLVAGVTYPASITLADGDYDDTDPVVIDKSLTIRGSRNAKIHSEFQVVSGAVVHFIGPTIEMNKVGAPQHDGFSADRFPQNGMFVVLGSELWLDDVEMHSLPGFNKEAIFAIGSTVHLRTVNQFSRIDWRNNPATVIELLYGSYGNFFDISGQNLTYSIVSQADSNSSANGAINLVGSRLTLSGANLYNFGSGLYGVNVQRASYIQCGAGVYTSIQYFAVPIAYDATPNTHWIAPGNFCGS